jgi:hypothetical protein
MRPEEESRKDAGQWNDNLGPTCHDRWLEGTGRLFARAETCRLDLLEDAGAAFRARWNAMTAARPSAMRTKILDHRDVSGGE